MSDQQQPADPNPAGAMPPDRKWPGFWPLVWAAFVALLAACLYEIALGGPSVFIDGTRFQWLALATFAVFIALAWRSTLYRLRHGIFLDRRNPMDMSLSRWKSRWRRGDG